MTTMPEPATTYSGPGGPGRVHAVTSRAQVADLAAWLLSPHRKDEVVVVSHSAAVIDSDHLAPLTTPSREVYTIAQRSSDQRSLTRELSKHLPTGTAVFGNAARLYPADRAWHTDASTARFFPYVEAAQLARFAEELTKRARKAGRPPGSQPRRPSPRAPRLGREVPGAASNPASPKPAQGAPTPTRPAPTPTSPAPNPISPAPAPVSAPSPAGADAAPAQTPATGVGGPGPRGSLPSDDVPGRHGTGTAAPGGATGATRESRDNGLAASGVVHRVDTVQGGRDLARHLLDSGRPYPVVVLSVDSAAHEPYFDAGHIAYELRGAAAVVRIAADATYGLTDGLGDKQWSVFYGAGRIYPVGTAWVRDMHKAPLHLCFSPAMAVRATPRVIDDALVAAHAAGVLRPASAGPESVAVTAEVRGTLGSHHIQVRTDDGRTAAMLAARLRVGVPADRLARKRQRLHGRFTVTGGFLGEFVPDPIPDDPAARARELLPSGSVTLARVHTVSDGSAAALLHPDVPIQIIDTFDEDAALVLSAGDVVGVEVVWEDDQALGALLSDPEPADLKPALAILPGGPPWLLPVDLEPEQPVPADQGPPGPDPTGLPQPASAPGASADTSQLGTADNSLPEAGSVRRLAELREINAVLTREAEAARSAVDRLEAEVRDLRRQLRRTAGKRSTRAVEPVWRDPERQLRHEVSLAFLDRVTEDERDEHPLPDDYVIGPDFIDSLERLQGITRSKVLRVIVECLTGLDAQTPSRKRRPWLSHSGGAQELRADGGAAWRINMQDYVAAARRLKYWRLTDGRIELDSVGSHDEGLRSRRP